MALTSTDKTWLADEIAKQLAAHHDAVPSAAEVASAVWDHTELDPADSTGKATRRAGGDMRFLEFRAAARQQQALAAVKDVRADVAQLASKLADPTS